jgi:serine/threonine-protein kinase
MTTVFNRIGPYQILRPIGQGGMAAVFLARDTRSSRDVALKLVQQGADREAAEIAAAERFGAELQRQFSQISAHVPAVYEHGADSESGYVFVAMEYLDGSNLSDLIAEGPLPVERAMAIATDVCRFLEDAHRFEAVVDGRQLRSLLHLDLKPRNVRLTSAGQVKVFDFGIAKALSLSRRVTRNDFGSIAYLSPERLQTGEVDPGADFWALGVVLHEMLSGSPPFRAADTRRLERLILARQPAPPLPAHCPTGLHGIVAKLLAPDPAQRYVDARTIREDFERMSAGIPTIAEKEGWAKQPVADDATRRTMPAAPPPLPSVPPPLPATGGPSRDVLEAEKTRRTRLAAQALPPAPPPVSAPSVPERGGTPAEARRTRPSWTSRLVRAAVLLVAAGLFFNELSIGREAAAVAGRAATHSLDELPLAWADYERLSARSRLNAAEDLAESLVERTLTLVDRIVANYRTPMPTVREAQWAVARNALARAIAAEPDNRQLRAALRLCEGHLLRINGEAKMARRELEEARRDLTDAVVAFREAAELRPDWSDPFVGLARAFGFGLSDVERAADAMDQARRRGHAPSERELAQLADGYRARGNTFVRNARELAGLPQERDYLDRAAEAYRQALELYAAAHDFANVPANIRLAQRALLQVEAKLSTPPLPSPLSAGDEVAAEAAPPQVPLASDVAQNAAPWP